MSSSTCSNGGNDKCECGHSTEKTCDFDSPVIEHCTGNAKVFVTTFTRLKCVHKLYIPLVTLHRRPSNLLVGKLCVIVELAPMKC